MKRLSKILFAIGVAFIVVGVLISFISDIKLTQPEHFKGLNKDTTREDILSIYGEPDETVEYIYPAGQFYDVYSVEYLGVNGEIQVRYFDDDTENVYCVEFIINSIGFDSPKDYRNAVKKTTEHFERACENMSRNDFSTDDKTSISFIDTEKEVNYMIYTNRIYNGSREEMNNLSTYDESKMSDCMCYQFSKVLTSE